MASLITLDFEFIKLSPQLGQFLVDVYSEFPEASVTDVTGKYSYKKDTQYITVGLPEAAAIMLKIKYMHEVRVRPPEVKFDADKTKFLMIKNRQTISKNNTYFDYETTWDDKWSKKYFTDQEIEVTKKLISETENWWDK